MTWKRVVLLLVAVFSVDAGAQTQVPRVGILFSGTAASSVERVKAVVEGMRGNGFVEGKGVRYDMRYGDANREKTSQEARALAGAKVDVILVMATQPSLAIMKATSSIPIVFALVADPVAAGLVKSLATPGGNVTGFSLQNPELRAKRLEILHELAPKLKRIGIMHDAATMAIYDTAQFYEQGAKSLGKEILNIETRSERDFDGVFLKLRNWRADAFYVTESPLAAAHGRALLQRAIKEGLPTVSGSRVYAEAGALISYGADYLDVVRRSTSYVARILKGDKPANLPVQNPTRFELIVNLKTAKALGITVPKDFLRRADEVIE